MSEQGLFRTFCDAHVEVQQAAQVSPLTAACGDERHASQHLSLVSLRVHSAEHEAG